MDNEILKAQYFILRSRDYKSLAGVQLRIIARAYYYTN